MAGPYDAGTTQVSYKKQSGFGSYHSSSPTVQILRLTGESLKKDTETAVSDELRSDRERSGLIRTSVGASGSIDFEWSSDAFDEFLESALFSDAAFTHDASDPQSSTSCTFSASTPGTITIGSSTWDNTPKPGDILTVTGTLNTGTFIVVKATDTVITTHEATVLETVASTTIVHHTSSETISNGTAFTYFEIERQYASTVVEHFKDMAVDDITMTIEPGSIVTGSFSLLGSDATSTGFSGSPTYAPATSDEIWNGVDVIDGVYENGAKLTGLTQVSFTMANNIRARNEIGTLGASSLGSGTIDLTGSVQLYFNSEAYFNQYINQTESNLLVVAQDAAGQIYTISIPALKYTSGQRVAGGINTDIIAEMEFTAFTDSTTGDTIKISKKS